MATTEQTFLVPASDLFAVLTDPETYPHWLVGTRHIRAVSSDWPVPGSFFKHTVGFGPIAIPDRTTVRGIDAPDMLELLVRARPAIEAVVVFQVAPTESGCALQMTETPVGLYKVMSAIAQPLIRLRNERSMTRLKAFVKSLAKSTTKGPSPAAGAPPAASA